MMELSYHGHSIVKIKTETFELLIDPFISGNLLTDLKVGEQNPSYILLTHGHNDHVGDTVEIAKRSGAKVIAPNELANYLATLGIETIGMNIGGQASFEFGMVKYTQAFHSSSFETDTGEIIYAGMPAGILLTLEGKTIYHAGDTSLFGDMRLIGERHEIDVAFLPIGDHFTMGPEDAAYATELLRPHLVVPVHYNTFPPIQQDPNVFKELVTQCEVTILQPGEMIER